MLKDDKEMDVFDEREVACLIKEESRGQSSLLKLLAWIDKFYGAYIRLGEKTEKLTPGMREDARAARSSLRRMALGHHLLLFSYHLNKDMDKEEEDRKC
jgi:predicted ABC-type transport system involved in lysophospholipase L1 biosynthesis ATPase subunit